MTKLLTIIFPAARTTFFLYVYLDSDKISYPVFSQTALITYTSVCRLSFSIDLYYYA